MVTMEVETGHCLCQAWVSLAIGMGLLGQTLLVWCLWTFERLETSIMVA